MKTKNVMRASISVLAIAMFGLTLAAPFASAQRPASVHIDWTIVLRGTALNGMTPIGNSDYEMRNTFRRFEADCDQINVPNGTVLDVKVNGKFVGSFRSLDQGGALILTGVRAPNVTKGTTVSINFHNGPAIVSGRY